MQNFPGAKLFILCEAMPSWSISEPPGAFCIEKAKKIISGSKPAPFFYARALHFFGNARPTAPAAPGRTRQDARKQGGFNTAAKKVNSK
jgi:hypothetical protein